MEIGGGGAGDFLFRYAAELGEFADGFEHEGRFIALSAFRDGREIGRVSLDQDAIRRRLAGRFLNIEGLGKRHDAAEAQNKNLPSRRDTEPAWPSSVRARGGYRHAAVST